MSSLNPLLSAAVLAVNNITNNQHRVLTSPSLPGADFPPSDRLTEEKVIVPNNLLTSDVSSDPLVSKHKG